MNIYIYREREREREREGEAYICMYKETKKLKPKFYLENKNKKQKT